MQFFLYRNHAILFDQQSVLSPQQQPQQDEENSGDSGETPLDEDCRRVKKRMVNSVYSFSNDKYNIHTKSAPIVGKLQYLLLHQITLRNILNTQLTKKKNYQILMHTYRTQTLCIT